MLRQDSVNSKEALHSRRVIICIVNRNARVALPDEEGLRYSLALLRAHGVGSALRL